MEGARKAEEIEERHDRLENLEVCVGEPATMSKPQVSDECQTA